MVTSDRCQHDGKAYDPLPLVFQKDPKMSNQLMDCAVVGMALVAMTLVVKPAAAQNTVAPQIIDPKACLDQERLRPGNGTARQPGASNQTLSEKLDRSEGVICPPLGVDPEIAVPPPDGGKTPLIPPPGSPGGNPTVRPK